MANEIEEKKLNRKLTFHTIQNYAMGVLWLALGLVCLFYEKLNIHISLTGSWNVILGSVFILYGLFRIYRGYKNKF
jgi:hypothetical protein